MSSPTRDQWDQYQRLVLQQFEATKSVIVTLTNEGALLRKDVQELKEVLQGTMRQPSGLLHQMDHLKNTVFDKDKGLEIRVEREEARSREEEKKEWYRRGWIAGAGAVGVLLAKVVEKWVGW